MWDPLKLELEAVVSLLIRVLETKLQRVLLTAARPHYGIFKIKFVFVDSSPHPPHTCYSLHPSPITSFPSTALEGKVPWVSETKKYLQL